ncbi:MAG TPA: pilus assembly protein TadG-related protein [Candidatus Sulfotelmatobacter sp.]
MVLVAIAMVAIIAMAALSIDVITLYLAREEAQRAADAAALAAARVISLSGMTGDTNNSDLSWQAVCGGPSSPASQAAIAVGTQSAVGGTVATSTSVTYSAAGGSGADCSAMPPAFAVNPQVTVVLTRASLPTFFSRIWGSTGNSVSATAVAEAYNPSNSGTFAGGTIIPVQPSCVKPWMVPNQDPRFPFLGIGTFCTPTGTACNKLVGLADGSIQNPGITLNGITAAGNTGVIGETFWLVPDCSYSGAPSGACSPLPIGNPQANLPPPGVQFKPQPNLLYVPGQAAYSPVAVPSCANVGAGGSPDYEPAIGGCDQSTQYQCGVQNTAGNAPMIDLSENLGVSQDVTNGVQCLIGEGDPGDSPPNGQDTFVNYAAPPVFPFQINAGINNPLGISGAPVTSSNSIVSLPIFDDSPPFALNPAGTTSVTIVGFLQVFINAVDPYGNIQVTVLNVAGCGNSGSGAIVSASPITGTSPVPIRLITPP